MIWGFLQRGGKHNLVLFYCCESLVTLGCFKVRRGGYNDSIARGASDQSGLRSLDVDVWARALSRFEYTTAEYQSSSRKKALLPQSNTCIMNAFQFTSIFFFTDCCFYLASNHRNRWKSAQEHQKKTPGLPTKSLQTSNNFHIKPQYVPNLCKHSLATAQIKTICLKLHRYMRTCDPIWPIRSRVAAFTAQMCCQREGLIKVTLMEMQLITAPCWRQGESLAGNMWRTRCGTWAESH